MDYGKDVYQPLGQKPWQCPRCGGELIDMLDTGFNAEALAKEGRCFLFGLTSFQCVGKRVVRCHEPLPYGGTCEATKGHSGEHVGPGAEHPSR